MSDWLALIKSIPGLAKAVADLIGDVSRLGSAGAKLGISKIDSARQAIEDQTAKASALTKAQVENETAIARAITDAAVKYIGAHGGQIAERALSRGLHQLMKEQHNREMVVVKTIEHLEHEPPEKVLEETPSDDWLNLFGRYAETASSEKLREHWASILAGEIRKPGSFSFITLHLASVLDERLAKTIEEIRPWIIDNQMIPLIGPMSEGSRYSDLLTLAGIGFLSMGPHANSLASSEEAGKPIEIEFQHATLLVPPRKQTKFLKTTLPSRGISLPAAIITQAGFELLNALPPVPETDELPTALAEYLRKDGFEDIKIEQKKG